MWLTEGKMAGGGNIYENHTTKPLLVTALVHNDDTGDKKVVLTVPSSGNISLRAGESMAFTCLIEGGRAISCDRGPVKCRFSVLVHST